MESYCNGEKGWKDSVNEGLKDSVNDDLESLFENIQLGIKPLDVTTYFLPKLTEKELELVERRETSYLQTFKVRNPDVDKTEMMLSESDSKYVYGRSWRRTFVINSPTNICKNSSEKQLCFKNGCNCSLQ